MKNLITKIAKLRLLDGYIGILGVIVWYKLLADYSGWLHLFELSARAWKINLFHVGVSYHALNNRNTSFAKYPPVTVKVKIGKWTLIDTGAKAAKQVSDSVAAYMAEEKQRATEKERLARAAQEAGL